MYVTTFFFSHFADEIPGTSDDSGVNNMPVHFNPDTTLSNVSEGEYFGCFQKFLVLLVLFLVQLCVKLSTIIFSFI